MLRSSCISPCHHPRTKGGSHRLAFTVPEATAEGSVNSKGDPEGRALLPEGSCHGRPSRWVGSDEGTARVVASALRERRAELRRNPDDEAHGDPSAPGRHDHRGAQQIARTFPWVTRTTITPEGIPQHRLGSI